MLDVIGQLSEMRVTGGELRPSVADADDGSPVELVIRYALVLHPTAVHESVLVRGAEPLGRPEFAFY